MVSKCIGVLGAQASAWPDESFAARKDVTAVGLPEDYSFEAETPEELYREAAENSELVLPTHMNVMSDHMPRSLEMKSMTNQDALEVKSAAEREGCGFGVALPSMYPFPINRVSRLRTRYSPVSLDEEVFVNELDLHSLDEIEGDKGMNNVYDLELFDDLWSGSKDYGRLLKNVEPTEIPWRIEPGKMKAQIWNQRIKPALKAWKP